jgi:glyoxylase-like metal-dependent hydrolase (beta-lactamase superfamily II)
MQCRVAACFGADQTAPSRQNERTMTTSLFGLPISHAAAWIFNCYIVEGDDGGLIVVDPGLPTVASSALQLVTGKLERDPGDITTIVCTHTHPDHVAGVTTIAAATPSADIVLPARCEKYLEGERPRTFPLIESSLRFMSVYVEQPFSARALKEFASAGRTLGFGGPEMLHLDFTPTRFIDSGEQVAGAAGWETIYTPGHTDDSTCLYHRDSATLISGDAVVTQDGDAWFNPEYVDLAGAKATEELLRSLDVQHLLPGHGLPIEAKNVWTNAKSPTDKPTGNGLLARCSRRFGKW